MSEPMTGKKAARARIYVSYGVAARATSDVSLDLL
jgi:hypothetical protein